MVNEETMGMTNKQFQGFIRLLLSKTKAAKRISPDNEELIELEDILQSMLEDD